MGKMVCVRVIPSAILRSILRLYSDAQLERPCEFCGPYTSLAVMTLVVAKEILRNTASTSKDYDTTGASCG